MYSVQYTEKRGIVVRSYKGLFITFEGTKEGLGKTTQTRLVAEKLRALGYDVVLTREPGGTELGQQLRALLLNPENQLSKATELFLLLADRAQHYKEVLKPALRDGKIVISDRYFDSTLVYQGAARGWKPALLWRLHQATTGTLLPNLTVVLDGNSHINRAENSPDRIEQEGTLFFDRVREAMLILSTKDSRYEVVNANWDREKLSQYIVDVMAERGLLELVKEPAE